MNTKEFESYTDNATEKCSGDCSRCEMRYECEESSISASRQRKKNAKRELERKQPKGSVRWW